MTKATPDQAFMQQLRDCFLSRQSNHFLLTGNVNDLCHCPWVKSLDADLRESYLPVTDYLRARLGMKKRLVITYNIAKGIQFSNKEDRDLAKTLYLSLFSSMERQSGVNSFEEVTTKSLAYVLPSLVLLRKICYASNQLPEDEKVSIAVIIEHVDSVLPNNAISHMNDNDRQRLIFFKEWLGETDFIESNHLLILISETASAVHESVRSMPRLININLPLPDQNERKRFLRQCLRSVKKLKLKGSQESFAELSAGMTLAGLEQTIRLAEYRKGMLERQDFVQYLNRLLTNQIGDYVELVRPSYSLKEVIGNTTLKKELGRITAVLKNGPKSTAPVGMLVTGPNGVGKTYIAMAWAGECDRVVLMLKNLRGSLFGQTDQIFEKIRNILEVLGNVIIVVDEADTVFAKPGANTHETEQRLFGNVIKMMGDTKNRSRIIWVLMTARPDNLAPDLKRSGRCGLHLPIFDPEGEDRHDFINFVLKECDFSLNDFNKSQRDNFLDLTSEYSAADFRELITELNMEKFINSGKLSAKSVLTVAKNYLPANIGKQRRAQTLQAVMHCSKRSLLPEKWKNLTREEVQKQFEMILTN